MATFRFGLIFGALAPLLIASCDSGARVQTDLAEHHFHYPFTAPDPLLEHAIQLALADAKVKRKIAGNRHAVVSASMAHEDKYRPCSTTYRCAFVVINYGSASLGVAVDLEESEVWEISVRATPELLPPRVNPDEAEQAALDHIRRVRGRKADVEASYVYKTIDVSRSTLCAYHGCWAVVLSTPDGQAELVGVDWIEATVVETIERRVEDRQ